MGETFNSDKKLKYASSVVELIVRVRSSYKHEFVDLKSAKDKAKFQAMDSVWNCFESSGAKLDELLAATAKTIDDPFLASLEKQNAIGDAFVVKVKQLRPDVQAQMKSKWDFTLENATRTGEENWSVEIQSQVQRLLDSILKVRAQFIYALKDITTQNNDPIYGSMYQKIGEILETFGNSWVVSTTQLKADLRTLGLKLDASLDEMNAAIAATSRKAAPVKGNVKIGKPVV